MVESSFHKDWIYTYKDMIIQSEQVIIIARPIGGPPEHKFCSYEC